MEDTWASGTMDLLSHAEAHAASPTAFDRRIAFVSVDNAVELILRAFLVMPRRTRGSKGPSREQLAAAEESFVALLDLVLQYAPAAFARAPPLDVEHYHRIRNTLYHEGTGLTVSAEYVERYGQIAKALLKDLLGVEFRPRHDRLGSLRPEVRARLLDELKEARRAKHGLAVRRGLEEARARGVMVGRGKGPGMLSKTEKELAEALFLQEKLGYPKIAHELTRRRKARGNPRDSRGNVIVVAPHKVRRALMEMGHVKGTGASYL